jgi:site-specific recombinase XerD
MKRNKNENMNALKEKIKQQLIAYRYSEGSYAQYMQIFSWLEDFMSEYGEIEYFPNLGFKFITEYRLNPQHYPSFFGKAKILVRRLDDIVKNKDFSMRLPFPLPSVPPQFQEWYKKYCDDLKKANCKQSTLASHKRYTARILDGLAEKVPSYDKLTAADLYEFFTEHESLPTHTCSVARRFFSFLFKNNVTQIDLSVCAPRPRLPRALPSIYTKDEINKVLAAVDRSESIGKRDYAVLLLASYLGMRSSDIVNLSVDNIDFTNKNISIIQLKTLTPQTLVLNAEIEESITDYINNGRPRSESNKLFLTSKAPYTPIVAGVCFSITEKYFKLAGVETQGRRGGPHALRASYATALVDKGVPYAVVQEALGHNDPDSSRHYIRTDVRRLKNCALDVPKPTGAFAVLLEDVEVIV